MNGDGYGPGTPARVVGIGSVVVIMVGAILMARSSFTPTEEGPSHPPAVQLDSAARPIAAEADVFRTTTRDLAPPPDAPRRKDAHPRTLELWRSTRAYPGAPPPIPHGLQGNEYRATECNACHERGGWVPRFASYAPVNPHPQFENCLQCHVPDDALVGTPFPGTEPDALCHQCHAPGEERPPFVPNDFRGAAWPEPDQRPFPDAPPPIPHDLQLRGNCVACHAAPGGVQEIRTPHPDRPNCRQCHVSVASLRQDTASVFQRASAAGASDTVGSP